MRVNAIVAGNFATEMFAGVPPDLAAAEAARVALRRAGSPDELVGTILYLAGQAASYTTGSLVHVDGGYRAPADRASATE